MTDFWQGQGIINTVIFFSSIKSLTFPMTPIPPFSNKFLNVKFKRSWKHLLFLKSNDQFCARLTAALFQAQSGKPKLLKEMLFPEDNWEEVLENCKEMQKYQAE